VKLSMEMSREWLLTFTQLRCSAPQFNIGSMLRRITDQTSQQRARPLSAQTARPTPSAHPPPQPRRPLSARSEGGGAHARPGVRAGRLFTGTTTSVSGAPRPAGLDDGGGVSLFATGSAGGDLMGMGGRVTAGSSSSVPASATAAPARDALRELPALSAEASGGEVVQGAGVGAGVGAGGGGRAAGFFSEQRAVLEELRYARQKSPVKSPVIVKRLLVADARVPQCESRSWLGARRRHPGQEPGAYPKAPCLAPEEHFVAPKEPCGRGR
jgi:hypothetical protein